MLIDRTVQLAIENGAFSHPVNIAVDEHDEPYYGMDNRYLINAPFHKFREYCRGFLKNLKDGYRRKSNYYRGSMINVS